MFMIVALKTHNLLWYDDTFFQQFTLHEKCLNMQFFLVRIFLYLVRIKDNADQKKLCSWTLFRSDKQYYLYGSNNQELIWMVFGRNNEIILWNPIFPLFPTINAFAYDVKILATYGAPNLRESLGKYLLSILFYITRNDKKDADFCLRNRKNKE